MKSFTAWLLVVCMVIVACAPRPTTLRQTDGVRVVRAQVRGIT